ncbi:MAG: hypothetical protein IJ067_09580 [Prevotella sp.]|nr:hypothetical protein [Prevotella sp.]
MSVHIRLIKNNIKRSSSFGKYFAKTVSQGEVTLNEIAAEACRNSGFSEGSVIGVTTELQEILKHRLREGHTQKGRFFLCTFGNNQPNRVKNRSVWLIIIKIFGQMDCFYYLCG